MTTATTTRQDIFLKEMMTATSRTGNSQDTDSVPAEQPIQLTKILHPFELFTKKRTDINNNSVEISLMGKTTEQASLDIQADHSVSVYLAEDCISNASTVQPTANNIIKKMHPITFSSVKKNDNKGSRSKNPNAALMSNSMNQPPKVAFRVKSHGKGCNGTVKLFVMPFVVTNQDTKLEQAYYLMIKAKRNSLGKGNNKYGIETAFMYQKTSNNDLVDQIIDRVQAFDASNILSVPTQSTKCNSVEDSVGQVLTLNESDSGSSGSTSLKRTNAVLNNQTNNKKRRSRSNSNTTQNEASKPKLRKVEGSVKEEKIVFNNNFLSNSPNLANSVVRSRVLSQGTVPGLLSHIDFTQQQQIPQAFVQQQQNQQQLGSFASMNDNNSQYTNNNNMWNNSYQQQPSTNNSISSLGASIRNQFVGVDYQKQRSFSQPLQQQQSYQPIHYYQPQTQNHLMYSDNRAIKRTLDDIFADDFNHVQQPYNNSSELHHIPSNFHLCVNDDDIMSVQHQEIVEIIDSIQMFGTSHINGDEEDALNFFC